MGNSRVLGRLVPIPEETKRSLATLSVRPQRIAWLIGDDFAFEDLVRIIRYNTTVWGGIFNALVPTDGAVLSEGWWETLGAYDPDVVVACGTITQSLTAEAEQRLQPFLVRGWKGLLIEEHGIDRLNSVRMLPVLANMLGTRGAGEVGSVIRVPVVNRDHPFFRYAVPQFGVLDEAYRDTYTQHLHGVAVDFDGATDIASYLDIVTSILDRRYPLELTGLHLASTTLYPEGISSRVIVCLAGDDYVQDLCAFWALRMSPRLGRADTIFLPIQPLGAEKSLNHLANWCNERLTGTNFMVIASSSIGSQELQAFRSRLAPLLRDEVEFIDIRLCNFTMGLFTVSHEEKREELTWQGNRTHLRRPLPAFDNRFLRNAASWVVNLDLAEPVRRQQGFIPPDFPQLNHILNGRPRRAWVKLSGYSIRKAHDVLSVRVNKSQSTEFVDIVLPSEEEVFRELLEAYGYESQLTDKCRYVAAMTQLLSNARGLDLLRERLFRNLFQRLAQSRKAYDLNSIQALVQCPKGQRPDFRKWLADLSRDRILLRGYRLRCPECNLEEWYALEDVSETVSCAGCLTVFQLPFNAQFHYRLNRLVDLGMEQGAIPVILTTILLQNLSKKSFLHLPGISAIRDDLEVDLDILASCDGHLLVAECKDLEGGHGEETAVEIAGQLGQTYRIASDIGSDVVLLSMMAANEDPVITELIDELNEQDGPSVHLLLLEDLERGYPVQATEPHLRRDQPGEVRRASLSDLLPKGRPDECWIKESGQRRISF
jgi:hypothetical protein